DKQNDIVYTNYRRYLQDAPNDKYILPITDKIIGNKGHNFIVAKLIGVHFSPQDRYPASWDIKKPSLLGKNLAPSKSNATAALNSYDNAMAYNTSIIASMMRQIKNSPEPGLFFFISDHGFCLFEGAGFNSGNCAKGFHIPFIIYANDAYLANKEHKRMFNKLKNFKDVSLTQRYLFETIASLSDISYPISNSSMDITKIEPSNIQKEERVVRYLNGTFHQYAQAIALES
ncbi:MAG: sulfatase-like hydrolase/transferase, partial [Elusimicrobiota bacterium]|nr:sulfatase-like hydrolase/transferase [Elusimicrobiota bacterium]